MALFDRPALLAGAGAAAAGWGIVAVPVLLLWVATPYADGDLTAVPRLAGALWLLAHGGPLHWDGAAGHATLGVAPLLVTALAAGLVHHAAARTGRRAEVVLGYLGVAVPAALLGLGSAPRTEPLPDLFWVGLLALLAALTGARRSTGEWGVAAGWQALRARGEWLGVWPVPTPEGGPARGVAERAIAEPGPVSAHAAGLPQDCAVSTTLSLGRPPLGVLQLFHPAGEEPEAEQLTRLATFGVRAAHALRTGEGARQLALELDRTRALLEVIVQATAELSVSHTLETAVERVAELLDVERVAV